LGSAREAALNVTIEKLVYGGEGLGHCEGHTVFVPFVLPEEVVAVRAVERKKKFVRGHVIEVVRPSPARAVPPCPHFTACGGCHYQHIPYEDQLRYKTEILRETLRRIGRVEWNAPIRAHASPPLGYRNRAQWKVRPLDGKHRVGYFRAGSTALCPVDECPILSPRLAETLAALAQLVRDGKLPETLREVEAFTDDADSRVLLSAALSQFATPAEATAETFRAVLPGVESVFLHETSRDRYELFGPGFITYRAAGNAYRVGHLSFFQTNRFLVEEMVRVVTEDVGGGLAFDLFAGVGFFSVPLGRKCARVVAVESNEAAVRDLIANTPSLPAEPVHADAEEFLKNCTESPDLVILDPPRAGVPQEALKRLAALAPQRIVYVSCDPATLARDLSLLTGASYAITEMHLFDVFPQTFHIETMVRLERRT